MSEYSQTRIQVRRGTAAQFAAANPVLGVGEPAFETDTNTFKLGDGTTAYSSLSAITGGGGGGGSGISNVVEDTTPQLGGPITPVGSATRSMIIDGSSTQIESASILLRGNGDASTTTNGFLVMKYDDASNKHAYLWNYEDGQIIFGTNGQQRVKISHTSGGAKARLGVNVTGYDPEYTLDVRGEARIRSSGLFDGNVEASGFVKTGGTSSQFLKADGSVDTSTYLTTEGGAVFNEDGASVDFRVEGDTDTDLFFVDGSADKVGISTNTPDYLFQVKQDATDLAGFTKWYTTGPVGSGNIQNLVVQAFGGAGAKGIYLSHYCNESDGSETQTLKNVIRMGEGIISLDDAYSTGLSTTYYPKLQVNTETGAVTFNNTYTFPTADGSADQVLKTDGAGNLSFGTIPKSDVTGITGAVAVANIVLISQSNYDALSSYDTNTLYHII
jgi:hypothetical protein